MNPNVLAVRADMSVRELAEFLALHQISGAPVLDARGRAVGVVSVTDVSEDDGDGRCVRDIMTPTVYTVPHDTPVSEAARTLIAGRIHRLFVTRAQRVVGIVTSLDLLKLLAGSARPAARGAPAVRRPALRAGARSSRR